MKRNWKVISPEELNYLNSWLLRFGRKDVYKYRNTPEIILNKYESDLIKFNQSYPHNTSDQRLAAINKYIDYILNVEPKYKKLLKLYNMKGYHIGLLLDYKNQNTWHKSYKRYTYIRFLVTMIDKEREAMSNLRK